jgi:hypothetical protein
MTRLALALAAATGATILATAPARARCAGPGVVTSPAAGAVLPPDPTIYLFVPRRAAEQGLARRIRVSADGVRVPARVEELSRGDAFHTLRVVVDSGKHKRLAVSAGVGWLARFTIDRAWRAPASRSVEVTMVERREDRWTCSFTDAWFLQFASRADAYRVEWAASADAWTRGAPSAAVFPPTEVDFWRHRAHERDASPGSIGLGHLNCFGYTIPAAALKGPLYVKVTALFADGSEGPVWREPLRIGGSASATVSPAPPRDAAPASPPAPTADSTTTTDSTTDALATGLVIAGAAVVAQTALAIVLLAARRSRQRRLSRSVPPR